MLWTLVLLALLLTLLGLRGEQARLSFYRQGAKALDGPTPPATVIVPVKGHDEGLRENLASLASLDYPRYELIVTARSAGDVDSTALPAKARLVLAGPGDPSTGEKINNLLAAVRAAGTESEVFVFADSDGRVTPQWLRALVTALHLPGAGASTGYRWHLPARPTAASLLRSVWNAVIAGGMGPGNNRFCWGGAMAIRRETFFSLNVPAWWHGAVSDDYRLSEAVRAAGLRIAFAPAALVASTDATSMSEFLSWTRRQLTITRFYAPPLWRLSVFAHAIYCGAMLAAVKIATVASLAALALQLGIGMYKGWNRIRCARLILHDHPILFQTFAKLHVLLVPVGTWLWLYSSLAAGFGNAIRWRGYRLTLRRLPKPAAEPPR
ncbi:MAG: glycosyltransferase [Bryobacterales bacterium]|nr:glycosyltransferase [Bryobacterales bacterium]